MGIVWFLAVLAVAAAAGDDYYSRSRCYDCNYAPSGFIKTASGWASAPKEVGFLKCALQTYADDILVEKCPCKSDTCFIRKDPNGMVYRGCADEENLPLGVNPRQNCKHQGPNKALWWFCNGELCNDGQLGEDEDRCGDPPLTNGFIHGYGAGKGNGHEVLNDYSSAYDDKSYQPPSKSGYDVKSHQPPAKSGYDAKSHQPAAKSGYGVKSHQPPAKSGYGAKSHQPPAKSGYDVKSHQPPAKSGYDVKSHQPPAKSGYDVKSHAPPPKSGYNVKSHEPPSKSGYDVKSHQPPAKSGYDAKSHEPPSKSGYNAKNHQPPAKSGYDNKNHQNLPALDSYYDSRYDSKNSYVDYSDSSKKSSDYSTLPLYDYQRKSEHNSKSYQTYDAYGGDYNPCDGKCAENPSGLFVDPSRSDHFIQCGCGNYGGRLCTCCKPFYLRCPTKTHFDDVTKVCT